MNSDTFSIVIDLYNTSIEFQQLIINRFHFVIPVFLVSYQILEFLRNWIIRLVYSHRFSEITHHLQSHTKRTAHTIRDWVMIVGFYSFSIQKIADVVYKPIDAFLCRM